MVQLNLKLTEHACGMGSTRHIFHFACMQACKIDDVKSIVQISCVRTRRVHDSLLIHACILGTHMPNLDYVQTNCKPRTAE